MNKNELLASLTEALDKGVIEPADVMRLVETPDQQTAGGVAAWLSRAFYYLGGGVVFLGLVFLVAEQWRDLATVGRIALTLGVGIGFLVSGVLLSGHARLGAAGPAFMLLSALLIPLGLFVTWDELGWNVESLTNQVKISALLAATYCAMYVLFRQTLLGIAALVFGTWFFFAITNWIAADAWYLHTEPFNAYRVMGMGFCYMFLGHWRTSTHHSFGWDQLLNIGACAVLWSGFELCGWKPEQNFVWELLYPVMVYGFVHLSGILRTRYLLWISALALGAYITRLTVQYFSDSLGWAFSLVVIGFLLMVVAYFTLRYSRRLGAKL